MIKIRKVKEEKFFEMHVTSKVTFKDVREAWDKIENFKKDHGSISAVIYFEDFQGLEPRAVLEDFNRAMDNHDGIKAVAFVADEKVFEIATKTLAPLFKLNVKHFSTDHLEDARSWVKSQSKQKKSAA